jgi:hypothetical protein
VERSRAWAVLKLRGRCVTAAGGTAHDENERTARATPSPARTATGTLDRRLRAREARRPLSTAAGRRGPAVGGRYRRNRSGHWRFRLVGDALPSRACLPRVDSAFRRARDFARGHRRWSSALPRASHHALRGRMMLGAGSTTAAGKLAPLRVDVAPALPPPSPSRLPFAHWFEAGRALPVPITTARTEYPSQGGGFSARCRCIQLLRLPVDSVQSRNGPQCT